MSNENDIAIVGMAAHLPGAGVDRGVLGQPARRRRVDPPAERGGAARRRRDAPTGCTTGTTCAAAAPLDGFEMFDGEFFGFSPKEAAIMDPQHRQFLECAWEALENAGHPPERFAGADRRLRRLRHEQLLLLQPLLEPRARRERRACSCCATPATTRTSSSTRVAYMLDLQGPERQRPDRLLDLARRRPLRRARACSSGECDMALAGGVTIELPHGRGYLYKEGEILSPDGHCRAFDHRAAGHGLRQRRRRRRAAPARRRARRRRPHLRGDQGHGGQQRRRRKVGYLAPSVDGQARGDRRGAGGRRRRPPRRIGYVECHGTGTDLGDPIEVAALTAGVPRDRPSARGFCRIGSVKTNIGHLDTAAGRRQPDQGGAGAAAPADPAEPRTSRRRTRRSTSRRARSASTTA